MVLIAPMGITALNARFCVQGSEYKLASILMKKKIFALSLFFLLFFGLTSAALAATDPTLTGLDEAAGQVSAFQNQTSQTYDYNFFSTKIGLIIGTVLTFVGVIFLILIIYAGILWMTAAGNEQSIAKARTIIINSAVGLIIVLAAYALTSFLGQQLLK